MTAWPWLSRSRPMRGQSQARIRSSIGGRGRQETFEAVTMAAYSDVRNAPDIPLLAPKFSRSRSSRLLELDDDQMDGCRADVFGPMRDGVAIQGIARHELVLGRLAIGPVAANPAAGDDMDDVRRVRMELLSLVWFEHRFEHPDTTVLELDANGLGIHDGRILGQGIPEACEHQ